MNVSSRELMEGVLNKLKTLGAKGERVLEMLKNVDKSKLYEKTASTVTKDLVTVKEQQFNNKSKYLYCDKDVHTFEKSSKL